MRFSASDRGPQCALLILLCYVLGFAPSFKMSAADVAEPVAALKPEEDTKMTETETEEEKKQRAVRQGACYTVHMSLLL